MSDAPAPTGLLVSIEGINGVGKDYLLERMRPRLTTPSRTIAEFSSRMLADGSPGLPEQILRAMKNASRGDHFLRAGAPRSETLLLLAVKTHDYERTRHLLEAGHTVLEGRSLHSTAVYQALILEPTRALETARSLLHMGARWRPLPDLTILVTDHVDTALARAEKRDGRNFTEEERALHHRADALFQQLAAESDRIRTLDRRNLSADAAAARMAQWVNDAGRAAESGALPRSRSAAAVTQQVIP